MSMMRPIAATPSARLIWSASAAQLPAPSSSCFVRCQLQQERQRLKDANLCFRMHCGIAIRIWFFACILGLVDQLPLKLPNAFGAPQFFNADFNFRCHGITSLPCRYGDNAAHVREWAANIAHLRFTSSSALLHPFASPPRIRPAPKSTSSAHPAPYRSIRPVKTSARRMAVAGRSPCYLCIRQSASVDYWLGTEGIGDASGRRAASLFIRLVPRSGGPNPPRPPP